MRRKVELRCIATWDRPTSG